MSVVQTISGVIRRRILVNYKVDPAVLRAQLPNGFRPKLVDGSAVAGICLIRLEEMRPKSMPAAMGMASENAAHRAAVEWEEAGDIREGVFIWRRHTSSWINHAVGARLFSGEHNLAQFDVRDAGDEIDFAMRSNHGFGIHLRGYSADALPSTSIFTSIQQASRFFENGSLGFSPRSMGDRLDAVRLEIADWHAEPLRVEDVHSTYFGDRSCFPEDAIAFDSALIMRDIAHEWRSVRSELCCPMDQESSCARL